MHGAALCYLDVRPSMTTMDPASPVRAPSRHDKEKGNKKGVRRSLAAPWSNHPMLCINVCIDDRLRPLPTILAFGSSREGLGNWNYEL